jgi:hypothetical protein
MFTTSPNDYIVALCIVYNNDTLWVEPQVARIGYRPKQQRAVAGPLGERKPEIFEN